jgi:hypothetical protein
MPVCKNPYMSGGVPCPCGKCMPCRINRKRLWTHRILLESYCHEKNSFVTLTYDEENLPKDGSLKPDHYQKFIKRLRKRLSPARIRYYAVGEYGDRTWRPHYHFALFGASCETADVTGQPHKGCDCSLCTAIRESWPYGFIVVGTLNKDSASYVSGYVTKKMTKEDDPRLSGRHPEFGRMSNRPGIGGHAASYIADALLSDHGNYMLSENGDVPISLKHGSRSLPLGRYLRDRIRKEIGFNEEETNEFKEQYKKEMLALQNDFLASPQAKTQPSFKHHLIAQDKQKVLNIENRSKIFRKEKSL